MFSSFFKILLNEKDKGKQSDLFKTIFSPFCNNEYELNTNQGLIGHYIKGSGNQHIFSSANKNINITILKNKYDSNLVIQLYKDKLKLVILAFLELISNDESISNSTLIGKIKLIQKKIYQTW